MKRICLIGLSALLLSSTVDARAASLSIDDKAYVALAVGGSVTAMKCDFKIVVGGLGAFADRTGIDGDTLQAAVQAAMRAMARQIYERDDLNPAITKLVLSGVIEVTSSIENNKAKACADWYKILLDQGIVQPRS